MDGLIVLNKPVGITSAKAVYRVRKITGQRKSGHAGTLDPGASGVLIICLGRGTKLVERLMDLPKTYRAAARLDVTSESFDSDRPLVPVPVDRPPPLEAVESALQSFVGVVEQVPPQVSAVKVGGVPAYKRVRRGQEVTLAARPVRIDAIRLLAYAWPSLEFEVTCGRGTYVRALIRDLGTRLGTGGCLTALCRTRVGPFSLDGATTFEAFEAAPPGRLVIPLLQAEALLPGAANARQQAFELTPFATGDRSLQ